MTGMICLYFGPADECRNCGGWTKAAGGPFEGDPRFCSEDCYADWDERYRRASQRAAWCEDCYADWDERYRRASQRAAWCEDCGYDQGEHAPDCAVSSSPSPVTEE